jgi:hypothetical protein
MQRTEFSLIRHTPNRSALTGLHPVHNVLRKWFVSTGRLTRESTQPGVAYEP